ncbi:MAG TPA: glycosyltransferase family 2 protein [Novosphingobium sp.]|nr:glycosyltransferase family 2 protein [Novosphingobium sp.]
MNFTSAFVRTVFWRPGRALSALYWQLTGRRKRARNRLRLEMAQSPRAYARWIASVERQEDVLAAAPDRIAQWPTRPLISVVLHLEAGSRQGQVERCLAALRAQCYPEWELVLVQSYDAPPTRSIDVPRLLLAPSRAGSRAQALALGAECARGSHILPIRAEHVLAPTALLHLATALQAQSPAPHLLYGDHDRVDRAGRRHSPWFKPEWNAELALGQDYVSQACLIRRDAARACLPIPPALADAATYALVLAVSALAEAQIVHVPHMLCHCTSGESVNEPAARAAVVERHLAGSGASLRLGSHGTVQVHWPLPDPAPLVSILVPTRDRLDLLRACITGVLNATRYPAFEVLIIDNGSQDPATLDYLARIAGNPRVRVLPWHRPFNYSAINNFAAREARGRYLCLLNNDVDVVDDQWLPALMRQAARPHVGAVGAKLLYADGRIQHAGVVVGLGDAAGHAHRFQRDSDCGYFARPHVAHYVSAVTGACLLVEKAKFEAVGGLDEEAFPVAFNDVDLCLKLAAAGYRNVYVPQAVLVHHESASRGHDSLAANRARYAGELAALRARWHTESFLDPLHHPELERSSETYLIRQPA